MTLTLPALYAAIFVLHAVLPARNVVGYVSGPNGETLSYRLNGPLVFLVSIAAWALACRQGWLEWDALYALRWQNAAWACGLGLLFTLFIVLREPRVPGWSFGKELYLGRAPNPQWLGGRVDAKMFLYLLGAVVLELNVLSFAAHNALTWRADPSPGVFLYAGLFTFFLLEYLVFEEVHLYTYDFVAERVGFKLGWGCFVFYPFFYAVGLWWLAEAPNPHTPLPLLVAYGALFFLGWALSRGANLQKFRFKKDPANRGHVLQRGFWGVSRHVNYLGELFMAAGLALSLGYPAAPGPWLYPLYYLVLLVPRQLADDRRCAEKYGAAWADYCKRVPYRIVPFVY